MLPGMRVADKPGTTLAAQRLPAATVRWYGERSKKASLVAPITFEPVVGDRDLWRPLASRATIPQRQRRRLTAPRQA